LPHSLYCDLAIRDLLSFPTRRSSDLSSVPVVNSRDDRKLCGIITNRDIRFIQNHDQKLDDVMIKEDLVTAKEGTSLDEARKILKDRKSTRLNSSHVSISYAVFCLKKK